MAEQVVTIPDGGGAFDRSMAWALACKDKPYNADNFVSESHVGGVFTFTFDTDKEGPPPLPPEWLVEPVPFVMDPEVAAAFATAEDAQDAARVAWLDASALATKKESGRG